MVRKKQNMPIPRLRAVISARYSSHAQKDVSIEQQVEECEAYAAANNMEVVGIYADRALTGKTDKRPEFQKMMRHAEKKQFDIIIAYKSNRMARNMLQALAYEDKLAAYGIRVVYVKEEFGDNAAGRFALRTMMNVNQFYSENMAEDIKRGLLYNAQNCLVTNGGLPMGYKKGEDGKYALDPPKDDIVREIFNRVANGEPFIDIANDLNDRGIKTSKGNAWNKGSFHRMLNNERYLGIYIYDDVRIEGGIPQIIDKELFLKVQNNIHNKRNLQGRHRVNGDYLLTGKLFCGKCGSPMVGISGTGKLGKLHYYYNCQKRRIEGNCDKAAARRDWAERELAAAIQHYLMDDEVLHKMTDLVIDQAKRYKDRSEIPLIESQLSEVRKSIKNLVSAIEQGIFTPTTKMRLEELEAEQTKLSNRLTMEHAEVLTVPREHILLWFSSLRRGNVEDKEYQKKLFDNFLIAVYLYDDHFKIEFNHTGKKRKVKAPFNFVDNVDKPGFSECSYKLSTAPPK